MGKTLILHDLSANDANGLLPEDTQRYTVFSAVPSVHCCVGCFGCWIKTPAQCVISDRGGDFSALMPYHEEVVVISRIVFGGLSPDVKAVLDRSIGFILPFFRNVNGEMHHLPRYEKAPDLRYIFYGPHITEREKATARKLTTANAVNFGSARSSSCFLESIHEIGGAVI